ncbi:MAG: GTP-binding protein [Anaerolineae bacterium]|nr:GTP-binding protein [Anaerolineae bacterium]
MISLSKKVCLLGDYAVGKTSLVRRFVYNLFDDKYLSTIGVKVSRKSIVLPRNGDLVELTLMLWDLAGSEEYDTVRASYLRGAAGAIIVCDLTRPASLESISCYAAELHRISPGARLVIAANKEDLRDQRQVADEQVAEQAAALHAAHYFTSAKTGANVEAVFRHLGQLLVS